MTKSIQQIKQNLQQLESATAETAVELEKLYQKYLSLLSRSVKQQLILASYQICTQFYPQSFLNLSLSNKQELQQAIRQIGIEVEPALSIIVEHKELDPEPRELNLVAELIRNLPKPKRSKSNESEGNSDNSENIAQIDLESVKAELEKIEFIEIDDSLEDNLESDNVDSESSPKQEVNFNNPEHLVRWHKQIERIIKKTLDYTSQKANKRLQSAEIIPNRIPNKIIDVAMQTDSNKRKRGNRQLENAPNILHLAIESDKEQKKSKSNKNIAHVSLLRLRIPELEFADPILNAQRGKIQTLMNKISKLNSQYKETKNEAAIAEAQAAWRSSWYED